MKITILGCYSATPRKDKHTSSQLIEINGKLFLIDCGEGTQMQLRKTKIKFNRINQYFYFPSTWRSFLWINWIN